RERQARLVVQGPSKENAEYYHKLLDDTRQEKERAERVLAERSQTFREMLARTHIGFDEVAAALPSNSALVAYVRYRHHDFTPTKPGGKHAEPTPHYLAFVWRHPKAEPRIVQLGPGVTVETLATTMRRQIAQESQSGGRAAKRSEAGYRVTGARLRRTVWDPVLPYVGNARSVFIVPDGALHLVNFSALPTGRFGYMIEAGRPLHYLAAERDLVTSKTRSGGGLLALGAPSFDDAELVAGKTPSAAEHQLLQQIASKSVYRGPRSACGDFQSLHFEPLPASERETEEVAVLWTKAGGQQSVAQLRGASVAGPSYVTYLRGSNASEA